ncbi:MAG: diadenylate cyclase CdaA [Clostridiales bacterium]|nr:diadenylate cyclase CdaA [Clostridiales bacterium]
MKGVYVVKEFFTDGRLLNFFNYITDYLGFRNIWDFIIALIDVGLVAYIFYKLMKLLKETRAWQLIKGVVVVLVASKIAQWIGFKTIAYLLNIIIQLLPIVIVILFQPEIRRALEGLGKKRVRDYFINREDRELGEMVAQIADAVDQMSKEKVGALIVIEMEIKLGEVIRSGTIIDAEVSSQLLQLIFTPNTPLHDGAVIIQGGKIHAAACYLPLTASLTLSKDLGTRHRAGIGVTESSDCISIIVSEETGTISIARNGVLTRNITPESLIRILTNALKSQVEPKHSKFVFWRRAKK